MNTADDLKIERVRTWLKAASNSFQQGAISREKNSDGDKKKKESEILRTLSQASEWENQIPFDGNTRSAQNVTQRRMKQT